LLIYLFLLKKIYLLIYFLLLYNKYMSLTRIDDSNIKELVKYYIEDNANLPDDLRITPIANWDVSNVTDMSYLFNNCASFNEPLNFWDVRKVTNMEHMFHGCASFNEPLDRWNVSNVTNMENMFHGCFSFNQPLNRWHIQDHIDIENMFQTSGMSLENIPHNRKKELLLRSHREILIRQHSKLIMARNKIDETITSELNSWFDSDISSTLHKFIALSNAEAEFIQDNSIDKIERAMQYEAELDFGNKRLIDGPSYRFFSLVTELLPEPLGNTIEEKIAQLSKLKFSVAIDKSNITVFLTCENAINLIPDNVKNAIKLKILLDLLFTEPDLSSTQYVITCDFFLKRGNPGLIHKDSSNYGSKYSQLKTTLLDDVEYVSLLTLNESETVMKGTQLLVDDINVRKVQDKILVGLPVSLGSNIIFYDPAFLHCTPEVEILDKVQPIRYSSIHGIIPCQFRKAKSMNLTEKEKQDIMKCLRENDRRFIRCHYIPLTDINSSRYEKITDGPKVEFDDFIDSKVDIDSELTRCLDTILQGESLQLSVTNPTELNNVLKKFEEHNMSMGGKRRTRKLYQPNKSSYQLRKSSYQQYRKSSQQHKTKKIVKFKLSKNNSNSVVIDTNKNLKNGVIYINNENIYKILKCYTGNTIIY